MQKARFKKGVRAASDWPAALTSDAPEIFESLLAQFRIAGGVLDGTVAKPVLNCPRVIPGIAKSRAAGVPQHVHMNLKGEAGALADALKCGCRVVPSSR
jgi:hypothetical protein